MIVLTPALDWLTLTTYLGELAAMAADAIKNHNKKLEGKAGIWRNYSGTWYGKHAFVGGRLEPCGTRFHHVVLLSGKWAEDLYKQMPPGMKCTRIDVQLTVSGNNTTLRELFNDLDREFLAGNVRRGISYIESRRKGTVYLGSRTSERFTRIYAKFDYQYNSFVRYEVEIKSDLANVVWGNVEQYGSLVASANWLLRDTDIMPGTILGKYSYLASVVRICEDIVSGREIPKPQRVYSESRTLNWFTSQVDSALKKMANDHEIDNRVLLDILSDWQRYVHESMER